MALQQLIFVTGLSGAGMSSALKSLEDIDYEVLDNFPLSLVDALLDGQKNSKKNIAIGIDSRTRNFTPTKLVSAVKKYNAKLVFVTCADRILLKRFTETRRKHPLAKDRTVSDGIAMERDLLEPAHKKADLVIDTSDTSIHDLRRIMSGHFSPKAQDQLTVTLMLSLIHI